jgi:NAD(P)-dependent dehydrogenase (short-subunit alcohol dehydrogenase family)
VSRSESIRSAAQRFAGVAECVDVLINNAAIYTDQYLSGISERRFREHWRMTKEGENSTIGAIFSTLFR